MKRKILIILVAIASLFLTGVSAEDLYDNEQKVTQVSNINTSELYSMPIDEFMYGSCIPRYTQRDIENRLGVKPYWRKGKKGKNYGIYKTDSSHYLIFTSDDTTYVDRWYVSEIPSKELFEKYVKKGVSIKVVALLDSDLTELVTDEHRNYTYTCHRFDDGTYKRLSYVRNSDGDFVVDKITEKKSMLPVVENLLDSDYVLIKDENQKREEEFLEKLKKLNEKPVRQEVKKPGGVSIKKVKVISKKSVRVTFKKVKNAKKYQIQYGYNRKFKKAKIKVVKKNYSVIKVSPGKTCYVRIRGINDGGKGKWSKVRKIKRKK